MKFNPPEIRRNIGILKFYEFSEFFNVRFNLKSRGLNLISRAFNLISSTLSIQWQFHGRNIHSLSFITYGSISETRKFKRGDGKGESYSIFARIGTRTNVRQQNQRHLQQVATVSVT